MKKNKKTETQQCQICGKSPRAGYNRPHSLHKTKRIIKPNLQKYQDKLICTRCLRSCSTTISGS